MFTCSSDVALLIRHCNLTVFSPVLHGEEFVGNSHCIHIPGGMPRLSTFGTGWHDALRFLTDYDCCTGVLFDDDSNLVTSNRLTAGSFGKLYTSGIWESTSDRLMRLSSMLAVTFNHTIICFFLPIIMTTWGNLLRLFSFYAFSADESCDGN